MLKMYYFCIKEVYPIVTIIVLASIEVSCQVNSSKISEPTTLSLLEGLILQDEANRTNLSLDIKLGMWVTVNNQSVASEQSTNNITIQAIDGDKIKQILEDSLHYLMNYLNKSFINLWLNVSKSIIETTMTRSNHELVNNAPLALREIPMGLKGAHSEYFKINKSVNYLANSYSSSTENKYSDVEEIIKQIHQTKSDNPVFEPSSEFTSLKKTNKYLTNDSITASTLDKTQHLNALIRQQYLLKKYKQRLQLKNLMLKKMLQRQHRRSTLMEKKYLNEINAPHSTPLILTRRLMRPSFDTDYTQDDRNYNINNFRRLNNHDWTLTPVLEQEIAQDLPSAKKGQLPYKNILQSNEFNADTDLDHTEAEHKENYDHVVYAENENPLNYDETIKNSEFSDRDISAQIDEHNGTEYYSSADAPLS